MKSSLVRLVAIVVSAVVATACAASRAPLVPAVTAPESAVPASLGVTAEDEVAARSARILSYHLMRLRIRNDARLRYPSDLVRRKGPIMKSAASFDIFVNCKTGGESCWGDPEGFQKNLSGSAFAALLTQYTGAPPTAITYGGSFSVTYHTYTKLLYQDDLLSILHAALLKNAKKAGYANVYHIFLPQGTDTCFDRSRSCYSPNHPPTNNFCAYHESVAFDDVPSHVIVSIEPYQDVKYCRSRASSGASALTNSTASTLVHETFESITDPGPAYAWFNFIFYEEVADLCETYQWKIALNGTVYSVQPMYSNAYHACAEGPKD